MESHVSNIEKGVAQEDKPESFHIAKAHDAAERGHAATDRYGQPLVDFDPIAEKRLLRKIDLFVIPTVAILYLFCFIDRANIGNARLAGFEKDLGLKGNDYNIVLTIFFVAYIVFEIPSNIACKWIGPGRFLPALTLGFGITSLGTAFVKNKHSASAVRFLLGMFEAGLFPGIAYYMSRWYRRSELAFRLSCYIVMAPLAGAFGGLLASAILKLESVGSLHTWRMIFAIEGIITCGLGIIGFFTMTDRPSTARWLTEDEKDLAIARVKSERVGTTEVLEQLDTRKVLRGIFSPVTLTTGLIFLLNNVTVQGLSVFAPTIIRTIYPHSSVISQQLHTVPPYVVGAFFTLFVPFISWKLDRRMICCICLAPLMIVGYAMFLRSENAHVRYGASFLVASGSFAFGALCNANASANVISDTARSGAIGTVVMMGNIGGLISTWSYLSFDAPNYHIGNGLNLACASVTFLLSIGLLVWMKWNNAKRERVDVDSALEGKSIKEVQVMDWKNPAWRWRY
ncbi:MFS transporter, putative [Talaromyces stipitatus ATCC 10500]|uniref:MFS transporter, putative n=1 Tax=Talaromyces stipitatus (strain ATCC 10500 / CBS 375.48 / QM 6759 / NRRL 1006) TaxID=441959 RepID=B8MJX5_TALSN|nr:MFS transporter, putative [Talaromyces stipitatus ATCC 10500]EED14792.1 MFS transporter, putative [Talaromyces stipitatus ATCC 10500]